MKKIIFMGTPEYAACVLNELYKHFEILAVFTQPDKASGRKMQITFSKVKELALEKEILLFQPQNLKSQTQEIAKLKPDFIVVAAYGQILPKEILDIAPCINLHASILPEFRGASPIQDMILQGKNLGGVSAMKMAQGLDNGDMLAFCICDITNKNSSELFSQFATMASNLIIKVINEYDDILPISQFDAISSKCKKIKKEDGKISFNDDSVSIWRKFLAFYPWPGIYLENGTKLLDIKILNEKAQIGKICAINKNSFCVGIKDGVIEIFSIQEAGKKALNAREYLNGKRLKIEDLFY